jgi:hypothetical protein
MQKLWITLSPTSALLASRVGDKNDTPILVIDERRVNFLMCQENKNIIGDSRHKLKLRRHVATPDDVYYHVL